MIRISLATTIDSTITAPGGQNEQEDGHQIELHVVGQIPAPDHTELLERIPVVDVQNVAPPKVMTSHVVIDTGTEHGLIVGVLQR